MSLVGAFPGLNELRRRTTRAPVNPYDKATIFSLYPRAIHEVKYTISPGTFDIAPGHPDRPAILIVGPSSWWREIDEQMPLLEIPNSALQVADSIVKDYCQGLLMCNMNDTMPGLFYIPGEIGYTELKTKYKAILDDYAARQKRWYEALVRLGDILWARSSGNPIVISDDMKLAARELGIEQKVWMSDYRQMSMSACFACGTLKDPKFPVCPSCRAIDPSHERAKDIKFAQ